MATIQTRPFLGVVAAVAATSLTLGLPAPAVAEVIDGTTGDDRLEGTSESDQIRGFAGYDTLLGFDLHDRLEGGGDDDLLFGGRGHDWLDGGPGYDGLRGGFGPDWLQSVDGTGEDQLYGGGQDDDVLVRAGTALVRGGAGSDDIIVRGDAVAQVYGDGGEDHVDVLGDAEATLYGGAGLDVLTASSSVGASLHGEGGDDWLFVVTVATGVRGGIGSDIVFLHEVGSLVTGPIEGGDGDDSLSTQNGQPDVVRCGPGHDTARIDLDDTVVECEVIQHQINGDNGDNVLTGSQHNDTFDALDGDDVLTGLAGDDAFYLGSGSDTAYGGVGNDEFYADDFGGFPEPDVVHCGDGFDYVFADTIDTVAADCEEVVRQ